MMPIPVLRFLPLSTFLLCLLLLSSCATYKPQFKTNSQKAVPAKKAIAHTFYVAGGFGNRADASNQLLLEKLESELARSSDSSTLIFTGDNISEDVQNWQTDKTLLDGQVALAKKFPGQTIFLPGNNEWKSFNMEKMEQGEEYLDDLDLENVKFYPKNGCPIEHKVINDQLDLILIDSKWFISNWGRVAYINKKCTDIVTRRRFLEELEGYINDGQDKNILIAMHHPIFSNGKYAGKETLSSHLLPFPIVGSLLNSISDLGGFSPDRLNSRRYNYLRILVSALAKASDRITLVSGHEESMQYLRGGNIHQIIAGSLGKKTATYRTKDRITTIGGSLEFEGVFSHGQIGFAKIEYFADGSSQVIFFGDDAQTHRFDVLPKLQTESPLNTPAVTTLKTKKDAVLDDKDALQKTAFYKFLWGERYRPYFGTEVSAPVAYLDTLYGGLKVTKQGGGHQSYSIRLEDKNGKEYSMRSLRKNALKFLKFKIKGIAYTEDDYEGTWTEEVISDFFTTAHPYMQLVINPLARAVGVNHSSPSLFYVPKQEALGALNKEFGNELYFIEERPSEEQENYKGYKRAIDEAGKIRDFESTTDMLEKIKSDESYTIDQRAFIRARVFDMLIGDWDRHQDQWRWVEYEKSDGDKEFLPIPRDRDNAFPKFDGAAMNLIHQFVPNSRRWETYAPDIKDIKWFNIGGNQVDRALLTEFDASVWKEEAEYIQKNLTEEQIAMAFQKLPIEVQDSTAQHIKSVLKKRLQNLPQFAMDYSKYLDKIVALHGTEKDDILEVVRLNNGQTKIVLKRLLSDELNEVMYERIFDDSVTKEIWIYGLGDDDRFMVSGQGESGIHIRLIGGYVEDTYNIENSKSLTVYDWEHESLVFQDQEPATRLTNIYQTNTYHWRFFEENSNILAPNLGFRTDDGFYVGATNTYLNNGFHGNPFRQKHVLSANYFFKFKAIEASYSGIFANIFPKWNFELDGYFTSNKFSENFFGFGNESLNEEDLFGRDYYRARLQKIRLGAGIAFHTLRLKLLYESFKVQELTDRYFTPANLNPQVFETQNYVGAETSLFYKNDDANDFPTKALYFGLTAGIKANIQDSDNSFGYLAFKTGFSHKLIPSGDLVLASTAEISSNIGDTYYFYHAPSLGGNNGLRGFRDERFSGKSYFYQTSDLRLRLMRIITPIAPVTVGLYGGFDYGRVWQDNENSNQWHTSQGGGLWISGFNFLAFNAGFFNSVEGNIIQIGFGFGF